MNTNRGTNHWATFVALAMAAIGIITRAWDRLLTAVLPRLSFGPASARRVKDEAVARRATSAPQPLGESTQLMS
ncbi:hypothetical protein [Streptomyces sp. NPDC021212]|uniref:hypothetical protein n=1 Tax=Streptomyces sp. NPDC021212 TaxID=3365118 RepID=UPI0037943A5C